MTKNHLELLAQMVLPSAILDYFSIVSIGQTATEIHIYLDEHASAALISAQILSQRASWTP